MGKITLPELGEGITKATVACWHVKTGDTVKKDDDLVELVTDKATFNVPADGDGTVKEIYVEEGKEADVGSVLAVIE
ncbi:MAG: biotin attachment protein [Candidatus Omnitrophica bacterium]|nr:biotin attachment protein [Candidatus Omnitrophota bacterium]